MTRSSREDCEGRAWEGVRGWEGVRTRELQCCPEQRVYEAADEAGGRPHDEKGPLGGARPEGGGRLADDDGQVECPAHHRAPHSATQQAHRRHRPIRT